MILTLVSLGNVFVLYENYFFYCQYGVRSKNTVNNLLKYKKCVRNEVSFQSQTSYVYIG